MTFILPPEPQARTIDPIIIPPELDPYFKQWYLATKQATDTPEDFALRTLVRAAMAWRQRKIKTTRYVEAQATDKSEEQEIEAITTNADL